VHSSTVTVAVMSEIAQHTIYDQREPDNFKIEWFNGTIGAGGQNHQKTANCARITHLPSGIVKTAQTRSRANSLKNAQAAILAALDEQSGQQHGQAANAVRKTHVGTGMRSDKRRTLQFQNGTVTDHITGRKAPLKLVMAGRFDLLWK
jgi:peptide chain release factor 1